ncbi:MAG: hypothetical protein ACK521_12315 [bacterium]|jgi:hypothetical protein
MADQFDRSTRYKEANSVTVPLYYEQTLNASLKQMQANNDLTSLDVSDEIETMSVSSRSSHFRDTLVDQDEADVLKNV